MKDARLEECHRIAKERGGECLETQWVGQQQRMRWRCGEKHEWKARFVTVRRGSWCFECGVVAAGEKKRLANFERIKVLVRKRGGAILSEYVRSGVPIRVRCKERHEWDVRPNSLQHGTWCPRCAGSLVTLEDIQEMAREHGGRVLSTEYKGVFEKMKFECAVGHQWETRVVNVRHKPAWCPVCAHGSKLTLEDLEALAAQFGGESLAREVTTVHADYPWRCIAGHEFTMSAHAVQQRHWCLPCRGKEADTLARIVAIAKRRGGEVLSKEYVNATTKMHVRCAEQHEWWTLPSSLIQGHWCFACAHTTSSTAPLSLEVFQKLAKERGGRCLSKHYINSSKKLEFECFSRHRFESNASQVRSGSWCPICSYRYPGTIDGMRRLARQRSGRCLSQEYTGKKTLVHFECVMRHRFKLLGTVAKTGVWCPTCPPERNEMMLRLEDELHDPSPVPSAVGASNE